MVHRSFVLRVIKCPEINLLHLKDIVKVSIVFLIRIVEDGIKFSGKLIIW